MQIATHTPGPKYTRFKGTCTTLSIDAPSGGVRKWETFVRNRTAAEELHRQGVET